MIAIVDDCKSQHLVYAIILKDYLVCHFFDGQGFIDSLEQGIIPDFLILDAVMPHKSGVEVLEYIKQNDIIGIKIALCTSLDGLPYEAMCDSYKIRYISKHGLNMTKEILTWLEEQI